MPCKYYSQNAPFLLLFYRLIEILVASTNCWRVRGFFFVLFRHKEPDIKVCPTIFDLPCIFLKTKKWQTFIAIFELSLNIEWLSSIHTIHKLCWRVAESARFARVVFLQLIICIFPFPKTLITYLCICNTITPFLLCVRIIWYRGLMIYDANEQTPAFL